MSERTFIELSLRGVSQGTDVLRSVHPGLFCEHCRLPRNPSPPDEIVLADDRLVPSPLSAADFDGLIFAKKSLIDLLDIDNIEKYLKIGSVRLLKKSAAQMLDKGYVPVCDDFESKLLENWIYLYSIDRIIIRGTQKAGYRICPGCGHTLYSAQGAQYIYPDPPKDIPIFQSSPNGILIDSRYLDRSRLPDARWLGSRILKVTEKPRDGFDLFPYPFG